MIGRIRGGGRPSGGLTEVGRGVSRQCVYNGETQTSERPSEPGHYTVHDRKGNKGVDPCVTVLYESWVNGCLT